MDGNLKWKTKSVIKATQKNHDIWTNLLKAKNNEIQSDNKSRICRKRDEIINHIGGRYFMRHKLVLYAEILLKWKKQK